MARKKRNSRKAGKSAKQPTQLKKLVLDVFYEHPSRIYNYKQISRRIGLNTKKGKTQVMDALQRLASDGSLMENEPGRYQLHVIAKIMTGTVDMTQRGSAYILIENLDVDVFIPAKDINKAFHGDLVEVKVIPESKKKLKGSVLRVIERRKTEFVGRLEANDKFAFFIADDPKMNQDIFIPQNKIGTAKNGQKVVVKITDWPDEARAPFGEIVEVLGYPGENDTEMNSILADYGFPLSFPEHVEQAAANIPLEISDEEIQKREDFRSTTTFTIDPVDAKDFDDALSFKTLSNGNLEIGIHIADVTHYVQPNSSIEKEAVSRATSVYLVDRVIPMLPEVLSNVVCSLRPHEDKLCYACIFEMDQDFKVVRHRIGRTIIHSDRRFTYEEVQEILEGAEGDFKAELLQLNTIAQFLRKKRLKSGSIAFDKVEVRFKLDEQRAPVGVILKTQKDAHKLIEEFMLLANQTVAQSIGQPRKKGEPVQPFVYRIHDTPDPEKLKTFSTFIKRFGYDYHFSQGNIADNLNELLQKVQGTHEENTIETMAIRTMAKAVYTTENIGHYGLGFSYYSHFTSPIRRYPDMMVHRLLTQYAERDHKVNVDHLEDQCKHSSEMEQQATNAERDSTKYFQVLFMQGTEGKEFDGFVSGLSEWGIYVEIEDNHCEGMIRLRDLSGDYFTFDEENYRVVGHNTGKTVNLGDKLRIQVKEADLVRRRLDFELVDYVEA